MDGIWLHPKGNNFRGKTMFIHQVNILYNINIKAAAKPVKDIFKKKKKKKPFWQKYSFWFAI